MATYEIIRETHGEATCLATTLARSTLVDHPHSGVFLHRGNLP